MTDGLGRSPVRALRLTMALEADTRAELVAALMNFALRVDRDEVTAGCWGGPSDGAIYELLFDPDMTHDLYHQQLREYLQKGADCHPPSKPVTTRARDWDSW
jgi:hypothetical protein